MIEIVTFTHTLADAGEDGIAAMLRRNVADKFLDEHGLPDACAAEQSDFTAFKKGNDEVYRFDARFKNLGFRCLFIKRRRCAVNRKTLYVFRKRTFSIDWLAKHIEQAAERGFSDWH